MLEPLAPKRPNPLFLSFAGLERVELALQHSLSEGFLHGRQAIALDAENTYLKWEEANSKVGQTRTAKETARRLADNTRKGYTSNQKVKPEDVLTNEVLAAQSEAQYNEALWNLIIAIADLERVTAGGITADFVAPR